MLNRCVGHGRRNFPQAHEPLAGQQRAGTGIRTRHSERGSRRPGAASQQEDQRGRAGSRSERSEESTSTDHRDPGTGLSRLGRQFAPRDVHLLTGYDHCLLGHGLYQLFEWTPTRLFNSEHGHGLRLPSAVCP